MLQQLRDEFNVCIKRWAFYMLNITRSKYENYKEKNLQMILNINNFEFNEQLHNLNGNDLNMSIDPNYLNLLIIQLGRVTIVINIRQEDGDYKLLKILHGSIEQIFREGLKNRWISVDSEWRQIFNLHVQ